MQYIYFMRHGETNFNLEGRVQGQADIPLNENGVTEAEITRDYFRDKGISFDRVYSSPLSRAVDTAATVAGIDAEVVIQDERVTELDFGADEGKKVSELSEGTLNLFYHPEKYVLPEGGESVDALKERCASFLEDIKKTLDENTGTERVLIVSHGAALRGFISCINSSRLEDFWVENLENCHVIMSSYEGGVMKIEEHMHPLGGTAYMVPPWKRLSGQAAEAVKKKEEADNA